ncbi:MAG TPA: toxin [Candidatus Kapabacteria bacterium]|nr:toxin [Candidatus Kapabacteria bacterium]
MKTYDWDKDKNEWLKKKRGISFEEVVAALDGGKKLDSYKHPNREKYPNQEILVVEIDRYAYLVPFLEDNQKVFFKTIYRSRKAKKKYLESIKKE